MIHFQSDRLAFSLLFISAIVFDSCRDNYSLRILRQDCHRSEFFIGPSLDRYYAEMDRFYDRPDADMWSQYAFQDSLFATGQFFPDLKRRYDRDALPEEYLQHRIDDALNQWHTSPFARELDFVGFCEYLLPYRYPRNHVVLVRCSKVLFLMRAFFSEGKNIVTESYIRPESSRSELLQSLSGNSILMKLESGRVKERHVFLCQKC